MPLSEDGMVVVGCEEREGEGNGEGGGETEEREIGKGGRVEKDGKYVRWMGSC